METKMNIVVIILITALILTLAGCSENEIAVCDTSIMIAGNSETNFKDQIVKEILVARNMTEEEHRNNGNYLSNEIPDIEEFYFPNLEIDGFELYRIGMRYGNISYYYAPKDVERDETGYFPFHEFGIQIVINWDERHNLSDIIKENPEMELTENGFAYTQGDNRIYAQAENVIFMIDVPPHMSKYEILRDLAYDVINSAELVIVDGYKLPETKEPPVTDKPEIVTTAEWKEVATEVATDMVEWDYEFSTTAVAG